MTKRKWPALKHCNGCGRSLPRSRYYRDASRPDGRSHYCQDCHKARMSRYWKETYYPANRVRLIAAATKNREDRRKQCQAS